MIRRTKMAFFCILLLCAWITTLEAASARKLIREGNRAYRTRQFDEALAKYKAALQSGADPAIAAYDMGNAHYSLGEPEAAQEAYTQSLRPTKPKELSESLYNLGNAYFQGQKYSEAIAAYIEALKRHPEDEDAKYNLELARRMLQQAQQNQEQQSQNEQNDEQQRQQDSSEQQEQGQEEQEQQQQQESQEKQQQERALREQQARQMTPEEAERILNALLQDEQDALKEVKKMKAVTRPKREKDW
ncbi:MAG: tetratricopeptide repeat protein [bacterium]